MSEILIKRLTERMEAMGKSPRSLSLAVSKSPDTVRDILRGKTETPRGTTLAALAAALDVSSEWLLGLDDSPAPKAGGNADKANGGEKQLPVLQPRTTMPTDVPVRGTVAGSFAKGAFQLTEDPVDWVRRPPALTGARDIYAVFIEGTSMIPEHRPGDLRFVNPHRPPRVGDSVIVQSRTHENAHIEATIGHLHRVTATHLEIGKLNPVSEVKISRDMVIAVHKVLTMNDLFGV